MPISLRLFDLKKLIFLKNLWLKQNKIKFIKRKIQNKILQFIWQLTKVQN